MANDSSDFMKDILATPLGELIAAIGMGVADAQAALDEASLARTLEMYANLDDKAFELMRLAGYQPTFYAIPETEVEANVSLSMGINATTSINSQGGIATEKSANRTRIYTTPTNASNTNMYNIQANASTKLKFKIVPVPPSNAISSMRVAPNLIGKTESEVQLLLRDFTLNYQIENDGGSGAVISQTPAGGTIIRENDLITINL